MTHIQDYDGDISFATDAWSSPNHYAYVAFTAHFEIQGQPIAIVLDVVEVLEVRMSNNCYNDAKIMAVTYRFKSCCGIHSSSSGL